MINGYDLISPFLTKIVPYLPNILFIILIIIATFFINKLTDVVYGFLRRKFGLTKASHVSKITIKFIIYSCSVLLILLNIPGIKENIIQIFGLVLGGIIAFSSSTIIANGMSGILIRMLRKYDIGDVVQFGEDIGKVTEVGLFHTELETPKRKLVVIPNHHVMSNSFSNLTKDSYVVNVAISIGYNVSRTKVEKLLLDAAKTTELKDAYVLVIALENYSVTYEINGSIEDVGKLFIVSSLLRKAILDKFNLAGVEIVSPMFNTIKKLDKKDKVLAPVSKVDTREEIKEVERAQEKVMFVKAEEKKKEKEDTGRLTELLDEENRLEDELGKAKKKGKKGDIKLADEAINRIKERIEHLEETIDAQKKEEEKK